ncbi:MAG TPA: hypothetical protein PL063_07170 [Candidatus Cloacimonadota bacterium]|nr:hypothetical protein [Candidatus Cloacimonadota bacterium]HQB41098.1 hypothetical protein [Candidatus Cloacimonadota bacterium]
MIFVYVDKNLERFKGRIVYAFEYVFTVLGYSWTIVDDVFSLPKDSLLIYYCKVLPENVEEFAYIVQSYSVILITADEDFYVIGSYTKEKLMKSIRRIEIENRVFPIISQMPFDFPVHVKSISDAEFAKFEFDLIGNVFFHLSEEETCWQKPNKKKKKDERNQFQFDEFQNFPYVNRILLLLDKTIQGIVSPRQILVKKCLWPQKEQIAFALSYNVNSLNKWKINTFFISIFESFFLLLTLKLGRFFRLTVSQLKFLISNDEPYWNFQSINDNEKSIKARSTWFLHSKAHKSDKIDYSFDDQLLIEELESIVHYGSELAFMPTHKASETNNFLDEYSHFSKELKTKNVGIRHLFRSNLSENSLIIERENGILYDSSLTSNLKYGFPIGTCTPYIVWSNVLKDKAKPIWEIPINFNEKAFSLSKYSVEDFEIVKSYIKDLFASAKEHKGLLHFNFNISSFSDIKYMYKLFSYILGQADLIPSYKASLKQIIMWLKKRNNVEIDVQDNLVCFSFPEDIDDFTVVFYGDYRVVSFEGGNCSIKNSTIRFYNIKKGTVVRVLFEREQNI